MAYVINPGAILQVTLDFTVNGQLNMALFHYVFQTGTAIADGKAAALDFISKIEVADELVPRFLDCISDEVLDLKVRAQWIWPARFRFVPSPTPPAAGGSLNAPLPSNVAAAITKYAETADRHGLGTLHIGGVPVTFVQDSLITVGGLIAYDALGDKMSSVYVLTTGQAMAPVLYRRGNPALSPVIIEANPQSTSRVSRRRTVGVGA